MIVDSGRRWRRPDAVMSPDRRRTAPGRASGKNSCSAELQQSIPGLRPSGPRRALDGLRRTGLWRADLRPRPPSRRRPSLRHEPCGRPVHGSPYCRPPLPIRCTAGYYNGVEARPNGWGRWDGTARRPSRSYVSLVPWPPGDARDRRLDGGGARMPRLEGRAALVTGSGTGDRTGDRPRHGGRGGVSGRPTTWTGPGRDGDG